MVRTRVEQLRDLIALEARATNTTPLLGGSALALLVVGFAGRHAHASRPGLEVALVIAGVLLCIGAAFLFDDPATDSVASAPTSLLFRRALRITLLSAVLAGVWGLLVLFVHARASNGLPLGLVSSAFVAMLAFTLAVASVTNRLGADGLGGIVGGPAVLLVIGLVRVLPPKFRFFDISARAGYAGTLRFSVATAICVLAIVWSSLDPGRVNRLRSLMRQRGK